MRNAINYDMKNKNIVGNIEPKTLTNTLSNPSLANDSKFGSYAVQSKFHPPNNSYTGSMSNGSKVVIETKTSR